MSHSESKVELSQVELKHVCQVKQKSKCLSGWESYFCTSTLLWPPSISPAHLSEPLISVSDTLWHYHCFHNFDRRFLLLSHSVTFIFPLYRAVFFYYTLRLSLSTLLMSHFLSLSLSEIFLSLPLPTVYFMSRVFMFNVTHLPHSPYI